MNMDMKKGLTYILTVSLVFSGIFFASHSPLLAFPSVLGTKVIGEQGVSVDGNLVEDPKTPIVANSSKPTFSGYTISNAEVLLIINSDPIEVKTLSDANGYWLYTMDTTLEVGQHTLSLKITDDMGVESEEMLAATFIVPEVKSSQTPAILGDTPLPKTPRINYLTITLIVLGSLALLGGTYAFLNRKPR